MNGLPKDGLRGYPIWVYISIFILLLGPIFLSLFLPSYSEIFSTLGATVLMPIVCGYAMTVIFPLIDHFRGKKQIPFQTKPIKMILHSVLRIAIFISSLYLIFSVVTPAWHGAYAVYIQHHQPNIIDVMVSDQAAGFSFPPLVSNINTQSGKTFLWFYGHTLPLGQAQRYTITLLPYSNIVISADALPNATSTQ
jgi:hypothetical protein